MTPIALEETLRSLVRQAQTTKEELKLSHIARKCGIPYNRLYRFMRKKEPDPLSTADAQLILDHLTPVSNAR